jgi:ribonuclease BN (tRNA processing enzyme)
MGKNKLIFLGTGGGRGVMFTQFRKTGGLYINLDKTEMIIDPGPGSLSNARHLNLKAENFKIAMLSHNHPDHNTDINAYLDGMKNPVLIAEKSCLKETEDFYPCISKYHQKKSDIRIALHGKEIKVDGIKITPIKANHYAPCVGFRIDSSVSIGYTSDGTYYKGQEKFFEGCDILIANVLVPLGKEPIEGRHMSTLQAAELINNIREKPKIVFISSFSFWMLRNNLGRQSGYIENKTKVKTMPAEDFMEVDLDTMEVKIL